MEQYKNNKTMCREGWESPNKFY